jgi:hypothetical protein
MSKGSNGVEHEMDAQGDTVMKEVATPIFQAINAPRVMSMNRVHLVEWMAARERYLRIMKSHNQANTVSIVDSFDPELLNSVAKYESSIVEEPTDEDLMAIINRQLRTGAIQGNSTAIDDIYEDLAMDLSNKDPYDRCLQLFTEFDRRARRGGLGIYFEVNPREKVKLLVKALRPEELRSRIEQMIKFEEPEAKVNMRHLWDIVCTKCALFNEYHLAQRAVRESRVRRVDRSSEAHPKATRKVERKTDRADRTNTNQPRPNGYGNREPRAPRKETSTPRDGCWHCGEAHWLSDCPKLDDAGRKAVSERKRAEFGTKKPALRRLRYLEGEQPSWTVTFEARSGKTVVVPTKADSGADDNMVPEELVEDLEKEGYDLKRARVDAREYELPGGKTVTCLQSVRLKMRLKTPQGYVTLRNAGREMGNPAGRSAVEENGYKRC